jgi:serine protease Do
MTLRHFTFPRMGVLILLTYLVVLVWGTESARAENPSFLGMQIQGMSPLLAEALGMSEVMGVLVRDVTLGGPADQAGIERGDLILKFGGTKILKFENLVAAARSLEPQDSVVLEVQRKKGIKEITIKAGVWPDGWHVTKGSFSGLADMGVTMAALTDKVRSRFNLRWGSTGVVVTLIDELKAPKMDLKVQDIIVQVNQETVWSPSRVNSLVKKAKKDNKKAVLLLVERFDGFRFVILPLQKIDSVK